MLPKVPLLPSSRVYSLATDVQVTSLGAVLMSNGPEKQQPHFNSSVVLPLKKKDGDTF